MTRPSGEAVIVATVVAAIGRQAGSAAPSECCGALLGRVGGGPTRIVACEPLRNRAPSAARWYEIDPGDVLRVQRRWEGRGQDIVGFYHSHPAGGTAPSARDAELAVPGYLYVIVAAAEPERMQCWRSEVPGAPLREVRLRPAGG